MFEETTLREVVIRIKNKQKQDVITMDIGLGDHGEVSAQQISTRLHFLFELGDEALIFYYNHSENMEKCLQTDIHHSAIVSQNMISLRIQPKISDELLANAPKSDSLRFKRSPERHIWEVFEIVEMWRYLYRNGTINEKGEREKINLDKAASIIGIPRKSLEDYYLLLRNGFSLGFQFPEHSRSKIGVLRLFVKEGKKQQKWKQKILTNEEEMLDNLRRQILGLTESEMDEQLFKVVDVKMDSGNSSSDGNSSDGSSSDENTIFQN